MYFNPKMVLTLCYPHKKSVKIRDVVQRPYPEVKYLRIGRLDAAHLIGRSTLAAAQLTAVPIIWCTL